MARGPQRVDDELMARVGRGEARARRSLAQRLAARVRRAAHILMGPIPEAEEAAIAALTDVVRAAASYTAGRSIGEWADGLSARSIVRFAQAMRKPEAFVGDRGAGGRLAMAEAARSVEDLLARLPPLTREVLALTQVFGFPAREIGRLTKHSDFEVREELEVGRGALVLLAQRRQPEGATVVDWRRFWALCDMREHGGLAEVNELELAEFARWPVVASLLETLATLRSFLDVASEERMTAADRSLLARALLGLSASSSQGEAPRNEHEDDASEVSPDFEGAAWIPPACITICVLMLAGAFFALARHEPRSSPQPAAPVAAQVALGRSSPTVEALPRAVVAARGAALLRGGEALLQGAALYESDEVSAADGVACLTLTPHAELCLGPRATLVLTKLARSGRALTLKRGRAVLSLETGATPLAFDVGPIQSVAERGVFGMEVDDHGTVVRTLLGQARSTAFGVTHELSAGVLSVRNGESAAELLPLAPERARRDWELFAAQRSAPSAARAAKSDAVAPTQPLEGPEVVDSAAGTREVPSVAGAAPGAVPSGAAVSPPAGEDPDSAP